MKRGGPAMLSGPVHAVGEKQILPSVPIVVDECNARTKRFRKILLSKRACVMGEGEAGRFRDVRKLNRWYSGPAHDVRGRQHEEGDHKTIEGSPSHCTMSPIEGVA